MRGPALFLPACLALAGSGCIVSPHSLPVEMTRAEAEALPPEALTRRIFGALSSTLLAYPVPTPGPQFIFRGLSELQFITPAFFPDVAGLCEAQFVEVFFSSPPNTMLPDPPVRVSYMRSSRVLILRDPDAVGRTWDRQRRDREVAACAEIDPRGRRLITNAFAHEAGLLLRWTADLLAAAQAGNSPDIPLTCDPQDGLGAADCLRTVGRMRIEAVDHVARCDDGGFPRILCYTVSDGYHQLDWELEVGARVRPVRVSYTFIITTG